MVHKGARILFALCATALMVGGTATPPAAGETPSGSTSITVFLKAPDTSALDRLAAATGLTQAERVSAVSRLVPSQASHTQVAGALRDEGFHVTGETSWSITASGATARAAALFGTRPALGKNPDLARRAAATGALPRVPLPLDSLVAGVYPTTGGPPAFGHATAGLDGTDLRNAGTPARVTPSTGQNDAGATIATLQLADFYGETSGFANSTKAADLTSYATDPKNALPDPVASGQYKAIKVDGGPSKSDDLTGGDVEVNLDQESILSTAPTANQHAYFAPNTNAGYNDVFAHVYDDVVANSHATAPDRHIVAMSVSWGDCESDTGARAIAILEPILRSVVAAGVTVFASSGDSGIYDCGSFDGTGLDNVQADVDYPASSPYVVGVGASNLSAVRSAPNTGTNWTEKAWSCSNSADCQVGNGGSGGGASGSESRYSDFGGFASPAYQRQAIDRAPFKSNARRLVPDITADGDPATGFAIYTSNPEQISENGGNYITMGGTSLASPISAAQLTNALSDAGHKTGVGLIHGALYSAYARTKSLADTDARRVFRDVTAGRNGYTKDKGTDPLVTAQPGYDTVSGLGGVLWAALVPYLLDTHRPTSSAAITIAKLHTSSWLNVTASWHVSGGADPQLLGGTHVRITRSGSSTPVYDHVTLPPSSRYSFTGLAGLTYQITVVGQDLRGHRSAAASATVQVPIDDSRFAASKQWSRVASSTDVGGSHLSSLTGAATASRRSYGRTFVLVVNTGPSSGWLGVYRQGQRIKTINLHTKSSGHKSVTIFATRKNAPRTFTFRPLSGKRVGIDALFVTR